MVVFGMMGLVIDRNRLRWIDATRGIAILITILGHCIGVLESREYRFILSFHMPLFFFLSGFCTKVKKEESFLGYFKRKVKNILCPQITFCFIQCMVDFIREPSERMGIVNNLFAWFLVVMFYVSILFYWLEKAGFQKNRGVRVVAYLVFMVFIIFMDQWKIQTVAHFEIIPMAMLFYLLGAHCSILDVTNYKWLHQIWIFVIPIVVCCSFWNEPVAMYLNSYGNLILFFIGAFCGIYVTCNIGWCTQNNKILIWFGQNSIYCFVLHFVLIKGLHFAGKHIFPQLALINYQYPIYWCYFLLCIVILMAIVPVCDFWLAPLFGKWKKSRKIVSQ